MALVWDIAAVGLAIAFSYILYSRRKAPSIHLPPSPPRDILIGHARRIPSRRGWGVYAKWGEKYGDVVYAEALGRPMIILNSAAAAHDLLEKKSSTFSDRPNVPVLDAMGWGLSLPNIPYGPRFRKHRRIFHKYFNPQAISAFRPTQDSELRKFVRRLMTSPDKFLTHIDDFITGTITSVTYGHEVVSENDPFVELVEDAVRSLTEIGNIGSTLLDIFPFMRYAPTWLPGMSVKRAIPKARELIDRVMTLPLQELKIKRANGSTPSCLMSDLLDKYEETHSSDAEHETDIMNIGATIYTAGSDTTKSALKTFFLLMAIYPEVAKKIQEELDASIGRDRLPCIDDRKELPYLECVLKETYRIHPPVPLGVPHMSTEVDQYREWTIPRGTTAITNIWQMMRDEEHFPDPDTFIPERHMASVAGSRGEVDLAEVSYDASSFVTEDDPSSLVFGFGRRVCPGKYFADSTLWIAAANVLALFDINPYADPKTGRIETPRLEIVGDGTITYPKAFRCTVTPRDAKQTEDLMSCIKPKVTLPSTENPIP